MTNDDLDHLCKMLQESHDTASKVTGMDDTMFLQALDGIKWLRAKLKQYQRAEAAAAMDRLAQFDEENGLIEGYPKPPVIKTLNGVIVNGGKAVPPKFDEEIGL